ncbi:hypothetical protein [Campylobacter sp. MIT 97-5078]|uniref:hypothetical protein n=1 Tax=Campylobacter sp. MIT 97-5078 TaxID=1548153 RepID=UPI000A727E13|nr:hypothetical protein [Campylobacter sp. MIT 97-5078]
MKKLALCVCVLALSACYISERGISNRFYDDCKPYYDASGTYHEECPKNWINLPLAPR